MQSIVNDPAVGANFLVLLIPKLGSGKHVEATATAFRAGTAPLSVPILPEADPKDKQVTMFRRLRRLLGL